MNPFDLAGPPFLVFYGLFCTVVLIGLYAIRRRSEEGDPARIDTSDPYLLACLRGGKRHVLSVAVVSLVDRGLLLAEDDGTVVARRGAGPIARRPVEKALLKHFASPKAGSSVFAESGLDGLTQAYEEQLRRVDLIPAAEATFRRMRLFLVGAALILGVSAIKLVVALQRGRHNVLFLILFTIFATGLAWMVSHPRLTARGKRLLGDVQHLFDDVRLRSSGILPGGASLELPLLAAVFGLSAVPQSRFPYVKKLFPKAASSDGGTFAGCGSSCGSGCGGGGCGGGCGGCGS